MSNSASIGSNHFPAQPAQFRIVLVSFLAGAIGLIAGLVAFALYKLIGLFTNLFFFHRWSTAFVGVQSHYLGAWVIAVPVMGGLIVGVMAKYGTSKIKGHGILEAMEAVLTNRSRLVGIITRGDMVRAIDQDPSGSMTVQAAGSTHLVMTYPDELVSEAAHKLLRFDIGRLPVVERGDNRKIVGYLGRAAILAARLRRFQDEHVLEPGWWKTAPSPQVK